MKRILEILLITIVMVIITGCKTTNNVLVDEADLFNTEIDVDVLTPLNEDEFLERIFNDYDGTINRDSITFDLSSVDFNRIGVYSVVVNYQDRLGSDKSISISVNVLDKTKPVLEGLKEYSLNVGDPMPDFLAGVKVIDNYDGNLVPTVDFSKVDLSQEGFYSVKYTATDSSQNKVEKSIIVKVIDPNSFYQITMNPEIKLAKGNTVVNFNKFVISVIDKNGQQLLNKGYTLQFDDSAIDYQSIGVYTLGVNLLNANQVVVKSIDVNVEVVYEVKIVFKELRVAYNEPNFKTTNLVNHLVDPSGNVVSYYTVTSDQTVDARKVGDQQITFNVLNYKSQVVYSETVTVHVYYLYSFTFNNRSTIYYNEVFNPNLFIDSVVDANGKLVDRMEAQLRIKTQELVSTSKLGKVYVTFELVNLQNHVYYSEMKELEVRYKYTLKTAEDLTIDFNQPFDLSKYISIYDENQNEVLPPNNLGLSVTTNDVNTSELGPVSVTYQLKENEVVLYEVTVTQNVVNKQFKLELLGTNTVNYHSTFSIFDYVKLIDQNTNQPADLQALGLTCVANLDTEVIGEQLVHLILVNQEGLVVYKEDLSFNVIYPYEIVFNEVDLYHGDSFDAMDYINHYVNAANEVVLLEEVGLQLVVEGTVDTSQLGKQTITYKIVNQEQLVIYIIEKEFEVKSLYTISFVDDLYINFGNSAYNVEDFISSISHNRLGEQLLNQDVFLSTLEDINVVSNTPVQVTFILKDQAGVIVYRETKEIQINKQFKINLTTDLNYYRGQNPYHFDFMDYVQSVVDSRGNEISIGDQYQIQVNGRINLNTPGSYPIEYELVYQFEEVLTFENAMIKVNFTGSQYQLKSPQQVLFMTLSEYNTNWNQLLDYVEVYDDKNNKVEVTEDFKIEIDHQEIIGIGHYEIMVSLFYQSNLMDTLSLLLYVYEPQYMIEVDPLIKVSSKDMNPFDYVKSLTDLNGNVVELGVFDPSTFEFGAYPLQNGYTFTVLPIDNNRYVYTIADVQNVIFYAIEVVEIQVENNLLIQLNSNVNIRLGDLSFDVHRLVREVKNGFGENLIIGQDVFVEYANLDVNKLGQQFISILFKNKEGLVLNTLNTLIYVVDSNYRAVINEPVNKIRVNQYDVSTFDVAKYIISIYDLDGNTIQLSQGYQLSYEGNIDFTRVGGYNLKVFITDLDQVKHFLAFIAIEVVPNYDIIFSKQIIEIPMNTTVQLTDYVVKTINFDPSQIRIVGQTYRATNEGYNSAYVRVYDLSGVLLYIEYILVRTYAPVHVTYKNSIDLSEGYSTIEELILGYSDRDYNPINLDEMGYHVEMIGEYDLSFVGMNRVILRIVDTTNQIIYEQELVIYVNSNYQLNIESNVNVGMNDPITSPTDLVHGGFSYIEGRVIEFGTVYFLSYEGEFDITIPGIYELIYILKDVNGNVLTRKKVVIQVIDYSVSIPEILNVEYKEPLIRVKVGTVHPNEFDLVPFIKRLYDNLGNDITGLGDVYKIKYPAMSVDFNTAGNYYLTYSLYHVARPDREYSFSVQLYVIENYQLEIGQTVYYTGESANLTDIVTIKDQQGNVVDKGKLYIETYGYVDFNAPGFYDVTYRIRDNYTYKFIYIEKVTFEVKTSGTIVFKDSITVDFGGYDYNPKEFIEAVYDRNQQPIDFMNMNVGCNYLDVYKVGVQTVTCYIYDLNDQVITMGTVEIEVVAPYTITFTTEEDMLRVHLFDSFNPEDLIQNVTDSEGNAVDQSIITIESNLDTSYNGVYYVTYLIMEGNKNVYYKSFQVEVWSEVSVYLNKDQVEILINTEFDPNSCIYQIVDVNTGPITIGEQYHLTIQTDLDTTLEGFYYIIYTVTDAEETILAQRKLEVFVRDPNFKLPTSIQFKTSEMKFVKGTMTVEQFNINDYIIEAYDENNQIIPRFKERFTVTSYHYITFHVPGTYTIILITNHNLYGGGIYSFVDVVITD